jgi:hypothetical protein
MRKVCADFGAELREFNGETIMHTGLTSGRLANLCQRSTGRRRAGHRGDAAPETLSLGRRQPGGERIEPGADLVVHGDRGPLTGCGQPGPQRPPVAGYLRPLDEAAALDPVDEAGDPGPLHAEKHGQLGHAPRPFDQDAQQPRLGRRQILLAGSPREHAVHQAGQADQPGRQVGACFFLQVLSRHRTPGNFAS